MNYITQFNIFQRNPSIKAISQHLHMGFIKVARKYQDIKVFLGDLFIFKNQIDFTEVDEGSLVAMGQLYNDYTMKLC